MKSKYKEYIDSLRSQYKKQNSLVKTSKEVKVVHHILPKALGGTDDKDNLIQVTRLEHFLCHYYLALELPKSTKEEKKNRNGQLFALRRTFQSLIKEMYKNL